jgi:hypothetical protein
MLFRLSALLSILEGSKRLRGKMAPILWRPYRFWLMIFFLSQFVTRNHPAWAFRILCVKEKDST